MAKEGAPHATMVEVFELRLKQLYPETEAEYSLGRKISPPGLKPDIHIRHKDGRRWVFEMVHHNAHAQHLLDNHARYMEAGVSDHWILWDDLQPQTPRAPSPDQGVMLSLIEEKRSFALTAPQRAILEMQEGKERYLYAFTIVQSRKIIPGKKSHECVPVRAVASSISRQASGVKGSAS